MDQTQVLDALWDVTYGLYLVTAQDGDKKNGLVLNTVMQVSLTPPQVAIAVHKENFTHGLITKNGIFGISVLKQGAPMTPFIGTFGFKSGRDIDKFAGVNFKTATTGVPLVTDWACSIMEAKVVQSVDVGTHTVFIAEVVSAEVLNKEPALTYEYYQTVMKGKAPRRAPTYKGKL